MISKGFEVIFTAFAIIAACNAYNLTTTSLLDDYITQHLRQLDQKCKSLENKIENFKNEFNNNVGVLDVLGKLMMSRLNEIENHLNPRELLDSLSKYCIKKYRGEIASVSSVHQSMLTCLKNGYNSLTPLVKPMEAIVNAFKVYKTTNVPRSLTDCRNKNRSSYLNSTECIVNLMRKANQAAFDYLSSFENQKILSSCNAEFQVKQIVDCNFKNVYMTSVQIGATMRIIEDCQAGKELCARQTTPIYHPQIEEQCPQVNVTSKDIDYKNQTIKNPFINLNSTVKCLRLHRV